MNTHNGTKVKNIILIGPMAAGKTTIGKHLAKQLNRPFYDSDEEIETRAGINISWIFDVEGEAGFRVREEKIIAELCQLDEIVLSTGGGAIKSEKTRKLLKEMGIVVYLSTSVEKQLQRTRNDSKRPLLKNAPSKKILLEQLALERNPLYIETAHIIIQTDIYKPKTVANMIIEEINTLNLKT
ncbi:shikimate kinase AroK [Thorsellia anophelis]|uniref:Shikimate kinase 1 n=1 Tax=Thorsellia anophelis DSM 18579 TaxID=1123402 RepID=A0A1H9Y522_9GAMM|nr:shikimate kinase AroK [Thorsellia anophelis]SES63929.1 shikimate kinase [Thorsellia anophelis DSM 18579]